MKKKIFCGLLALLMLCFPVKTQAEGAASCTLTCDRTDELYQEIVESEDFAEKYAEMQDRFDFIYNTASDGISGYDVDYHQVENVTVEVDGSRVSLQDALTDGQITVEQLIADARKDAEAGLCQESFDSDLGVSRFIYTYENWEIIFTDDVLEAPSGDSYRIRHLTVCAPGLSESLSYAYYDMSTPFHYKLYREDWGLDFTVSQVDAQGITLEITQSGGQQFGELSIFGYTLYDTELQYIVSGAMDASIVMDGTTTVTISWEDEADALASGDYYIGLSIIDNYDEEDVHPLAQNFADWQSYYVEFSIA